MRIVAIRKPNSSGTEQGKDGPVTFTTIRFGSRDRQ